MPRTFLDRVHDHLAIVPLFLSHGKPAATGHPAELQSRGKGQKQKKDPVLPKT
jgi:sirohydrochlorin ferrochelatase